MTEDFVVEAPEKGQKITYQWGTKVSKAIRGLQNYADTNGNGDTSKKSNSTIPFSVSRIYGSDMGDEGCAWSVYIPKGSININNVQYDAEDVMISAIPSKQNQFDKGVGHYNLMPKIGSYLPQAEYPFSLWLMQYRNGSDLLSTAMVCLSGTDTLGNLDLSSQLSSRQDLYEEYELSTATLLGAYKLGEYNGEYPLHTLSVAGQTKNTLMEDRKYKYTNVIQSGLNVGTVNEVDLTPFSIVKPENYLGDNYERWKFKNRYCQIGGFTYHAPDVEVMIYNNVIGYICLVANTNYSSDGHMNVTLNIVTCIGDDELLELQQDYSKVCIPLYRYNNKQVVCDMRKMPYMSTLEQFGADVLSSYNQDTTES